MIFAISDLFDEAADAVKEITSGAVGAGVPVLAVAAAGEAGVSAVGITTGLAALGCGSMLAGVAVVGLIGVGSYYGTKKLIEVLSDND
ncbi:hypothetical protein [Citrobacter portucalensis]|uniref:hypothetical protein n=1 Tax=Citrobacter portucalensis TaxID=1639133 RepID=UPI00226B8D58|nr:hypothetical protein [Citrobacter portucalensis]MCX9070649.1 hypothetical protein [Citrobacter portucalensis]